MATLAGKKSLEGSAQGYTMSCIYFVIIESNAVKQNKIKDVGTCIVLYNLSFLHTANSHTYFLCFLVLPSLHLSTFLDDVFVYCMHTPTRKISEHNYVMASLMKTITKT